MSPLDPTDPSDIRRRVTLELGRCRRRGESIWAFSTETVATPGVRDIIERRGCRLVRYNPQLWIVELAPPRPAAPGEWVAEAKGTGNVWSGAGTPTAGVMTAT